MRLTPNQVAQAQYLDKPMWCVYGSKFSPQIISCKISSAAGAPTIWGYSEYQNSPKYRTLGIDLAEWVSKYIYDKNVCEFYDIHEEAIDRIKTFTTPKKIKS